MPVQLSCRKGHAWRGASAAEPCPVCAIDDAADDELEAHVYADTLVDELPPPPRSSLIDKLPSIKKVDDNDRSVPLPKVLGYEVERVLGRGAIGVVYLARHKSLNRPVALKMLLGGAVGAAHNRQRFHAEAEAVALLRHPNIVQ